VTKKNNNKILWFSGVIIVSILFGTIYTVSQQVLRQSANDPQIQLAEDAAASLSSGQQPSDVVSGKVDITNSLAPFLVVVDKSGDVVAGNGYINGELMNDVPFGSLIASNNVPYNAVTWQTDGNLRFASVSVATNNYYIFSARSLKEVEKRESLLLKITLLGWLLTIFTILVTYIYLSYKLKKHTKLHKKEQISKLAQNVSITPPHQHPQALTSQINTPTSHEKVSEAVRVQPTAPTSIQHHQRSENLHAPTRIKISN
jgi:hypothetical protein